MWFQRTITRIWGCTILDTQEADLAREVDKAFATKPCFGMRHIFATIQKIGGDQGLSRKCLLWTEDHYEDDSSLEPALCQICNKSSHEPKTKEMLEKELDSQQPLMKLKGEEMDGDLNLS